SEEGVEGASRAFGHAANGTARGVRDPALEAEVGRLAQDEVAEPDALDSPDHGGIESHAAIGRRPRVPPSGHAALRPLARVSASRGRPNRARAPVTRWPR